MFEYGKYGYFSDKISSSEDELEFISSMERRGAQGRISSYGLLDASAAQRYEDAGIVTCWVPAPSVMKNYQATAESEYILVPWIRFCRQSMGRESVSWSLFLLFNLLRNVR